MSHDLESTVEAGSLFQRLQLALPRGLACELTLHDARGELLWRSGGRSDSRTAHDLHEAFDAFVLGVASDHLRVPLDAGRTALLLPARGPGGALAGIATVIVETQALAALTAGGGFPFESLQRALAEVGEVLHRISEESADSGPPAAGLDGIGPSRASSIPPGQASPELDRMFAELRDQPLELHVQPLARLRSGARTRRFEVLLRTPGTGDRAAPRELLEAARAHGLDSMIDRRVLSQLIAWLIRQRSDWTGGTPFFSINLSETALLEAHFFRFVELCVRKSSLPPEWLGFELPERACAAHPAAALRAVQALTALGCRTVIDDFTMHPLVLPLFESAGIALVKIAPELTGQAPQSRLAAARVAGLAQAMKLLGVEVAAKRVEDDAQCEWLKTVGVDFVQSFRLGPPRPLESFEPRAAA